MLWLMFKCRLYVIGGRLCINVALKLKSIAIILANKADRLQAILKAKQQNLQ